MGSIFLILSVLSINIQAERFEGNHHASVLMYHHISGDTPSSTSTDVETFIQHLDLLDDLGFQVWPLERLAVHLATNRSIPDKVAVLTFDDAYISIFETAMPILQARNLPFTIFVNAAHVSPNGRRYMNWDQLRQAKAQGATLANHSLHHNHLIRQRPDEQHEDWLIRVSQEITENQRQLEEQLSEGDEAPEEGTPKLFAYPYGEFNPALEALLAKLGYLAFGQQSGAASRFTSLQGIPRYAANGVYANPETLKTKLLALPFPLLSESPSSGVLAPETRSPTLTLTLAEGDYRLAQLRCYGPGGDVLQVEKERLKGAVKLTVKTTHRLDAGRHRYNCTAPHKRLKRWFWYSRQWMLPEEDGRWYKN